jgi:MerR family mercuric resistance operon transcriptional regulator
MPAIAPATIAQLSQLSGIDVDSIRNYEALGLLPKPRRRRGRSGDVAYHGEHLERLRFIRRALAHGFTLDLIGELLGAYRTCGDVYLITQRALAAIRAAGAKPSPVLEQLIEICPRRGPDSECPVLAELRRPD